MNIEALGWNEHFASRFAELESSRLRPGRVVFQSRSLVRVGAEEGELWARTSGRLRRSRPEDQPVCGDWVAMEIIPGEKRAILHRVLERRSCFSRRRPGRGVSEQVVAANVDTVFLVTGLDGDFNLRRLERYLVLAGASGAEPVVVLNKEDVCCSTESRLDAARSVARGIPVRAISALHGWGLEALSDWLRPGRTVALLGSSGAGKSTLLNRLLGKPEQKVLPVVEGTDRGRHTTSARQLFLLPAGGLILDTPGLRELPLWGGGEGLADAFDDIGELAARCRFRDCGHEGDEGCAVARAVEEGSLAPGRLQSFFKLRREMTRLEQRQRMSPSRIERERWKKCAAEAKQMRKQAKDRQEFR